MRWASAARDLRAISAAFAVVRQYLRHFRAGGGSTLVMSAIEKLPQTSATAHVQGADALGA